MAKKEAEDSATTPAKHLFAHGCLSYVQIPAVNVRESAAFYEKIFGWHRQGDGIDHLSFSDATGHMIGAWVTNRAISRDPGVLLYIYVHGIDGVLQQISASGGAIIERPYPEGNLWVATFQDPAGNVIGVWQQGPRA